MASSDIGDWYRRIPDITRYWFTGSIVLPLIGKLGLISHYTMFLNFELFLYKFQIWRPITGLLYYPIMPQTGFHYLINLYFLYSYSTRLETGQFAGKPADYVFLFLFNWICLVILGFIAEIPLLMDPMILSVLYVWCQCNKDQIVTFWFGTQFKAMYLPWILVAFNIIIRGGGFLDLLGILVGHLYYFLKFKYPQDFGGQQFLNTPGFLYSYFPNVRGGMGGFGATAPRRAAPGNEGRYQWGRGNTLGGN